MVVDSVLNRRLISQAEYDHWVAGLPRRIAEKLLFVDGRSQSGTETKVRLWLRQERFVVQPQAFFPGVGYVDLLVGDHTVIECDSRKHHLGDQHLVDLHRALDLEAMGLRVLRLNPEQVMDDWEATKHALLAILAPHQRRPS